VASEAALRPEPARAFAVRALGRAGPRAIPKLSEIATNTSYSPSERAHAVRDLARLGAEGQAALGSVLAGLLPEKKPLDQQLLVSSAYGPISSALEALTPGTASARTTLERLAKLTLPDKAGAAMRRRLMTLRCAASALLASTSADARLLACDLDPKGRTGRLAVVRVLDRGRINGPRYTRWKALVDSGDPRVRQAAIGLMPAHPEIAAPHQVLAAALAAKDDGTVAAAAEVIRAYPDRASNARTEQRRDGRGKEQGAETKEPLPIKPDPGVVSALTRALETARAPDAVEARAALIDAAAALELLNLKRHVQADCTSDNPTLRQRAEKALRLFGERGRTCKKFTPPARGPGELDAPVTRKTTLRFVTDAGEHRMTLDPEHAPVAVTRIVELSRAGFFNGNVVHRVVPGFVVQFGDPGGDGYGGAGRPPLRCETSPFGFAANSVGVALAGRDTGSSQIFVTLGRFPHLDGDYTLLGNADPSWEILAEGDVIQSVQLLP
jgi:cyclophilin family peptidyl-prolyl cis-trans isomerase